MVYLALANRLSCRHLPVSRGRLGLGIAHGFTLVEFVLVAAISVIVLMVAARLSVSEARSAIRTYVYQSLRDQVARVTFLIEGEVAEASDLTLTEPDVCKDSANRPSGGVFLFAFTHQYTKSQSAADATICYFNNKASGGDLYRYGPKFNDQDGSLMASASYLGLVSRTTDLLNDPNSSATRPNSRPTVTQGLLEYYITIGTRATASGSIWNLSYTPRLSNNRTPVLQVARIGTACMSSASTVSTGCW
jgi:hypothetical protein